MQERRSRKRFGNAILAGLAALLAVSITACSDDDFGQERLVSDMAMMLPDLRVVPIDLVPAPTCNDGVKNGQETDVDCGGANCAKCALAKKCVASTDCLNAVCKNSVCVSPFGCESLFQCKNKCATQACQD